MMACGDYSWCTDTTTAAPPAYLSMRFRPIPGWPLTVFCIHSGDSWDVWCEYWWLRLENAR